MEKVIVSTPSGCPVLEFVIQRHPSMMVAPAFFHYGIGQSFNQGKPVSVGLTEFKVIQVVLNRKGCVVEEMLASAGP